MKPSTTLTAVRVSFMPTLNASSAERGACAAERVDEERLLGADAAGADGHERGEALRGLDEQHVAERLVDPEGVEHEPDRREPKAQSASCQSTTVRSQRAGVRRT